MTFYEAALRILEEARAPLHYSEITQRSMDKGLLSHVGKQPDMVMLARLAAMAKRPRERKIMVTAKDTFALTDWMLVEDAAALADTGVPEVNAEAEMPPLRPAERHPMPRSEMARAAGRTGDRHERHERPRREERERGRKRYPPLSEVAFEMLSAAGPGAALTVPELLEAARAKELASAELAERQFLTAVLEDNQRRLDGGRKPQFSWSLTDGVGRLSLDVAEGAGVELQAALALAAQVPFENGRPLLRVRPVDVATTVVSEDDALLFSSAKTAVREARRAVSRNLRTKLRELDAGILERAAVHLLHALGFREVKVAKRSKDGPLFTARLRDGSLEIRYALRLLRSAVPVDRRAVQDLRRDLGHYAANAGVIMSAGEIRGEAKGEAVGTGSVISLWCGEGLADKFLEAEVGVRAQTLALYKIDDAFFGSASREAEESARRREERHRERDAATGQAPAESAPSAPSSSAQVGQDSDDVGADSDSDGGEDGADFEGDDDAPAAESGLSAGSVQPGEGGSGRKRRRRRRRRGGAGPGASPLANATPVTDPVAASVSPDVPPPPPPPTAPTEG